MLQGAGVFANFGTGRRQAGFFLRWLVSLFLPFSYSYLHHWLQGIWRKGKKNESENELATARSTSGLSGCLFLTSPPSTSVPPFQASDRKTIAELVGW